MAGRSICRGETSTQVTGTSRVPVTSILELACGLRSIGACRQVLCWLGETFTADDGQTRILREARIGLRLSAQVKSAAAGRRDDLGVPAYAAQTNRVESPYPPHRIAWFVAHYPHRKVTPDSCRLFENRREGSKVIARHVVVTRASSWPTVKTTALCTSCRRRVSRIRCWRRRAR